MSGNNLKSIKYGSSPWEIPGELPVVFYKVNDPLAMRLPINKPFIAVDDRFTYLLSGSMDISVNMHPFKVRAGQAIYTAKGSLVEIVKESRDLELQSCTLQAKPMDNAHPHHRVFDISEAQKLRIPHYFDLLVSLTPRAPMVAERVQQALLADMFTEGQVVDVEHRPLQHRTIFNDFIDLVTEYATTQRSVEFYATRLKVTPTRLMSLIKKLSGRTVMQWVNQRTLMHAKALLAYSDKPIAEIGAELGIDDPNYFSRFFHHETGMTPSKYRKLNS